MKTLAEAVEHIATSIEQKEYEKTKELTKTMDLDEMASNVHHTLGQFLRNELGLWRDSSKELRKSIWESMSQVRKDRYDNHWKKYDKLYQGENMHADDASHELLVATLKYIKEND